MLQFEESCLQKNISCLHYSCHFNFMAVQFSVILENLHGLLSLLRLIVLYPVLWNKKRI